MGVNVTGLNSEVITVTTAGTRVPLSATPKYVSYLAIKSPVTGNTGQIYVGGVTVSSTNGYPLQPSTATVSTEIVIHSAMLGMQGEEFDLSQIYLDATTNGNTALILYDKKYST